MSIIIYACPFCHSAKIMGRWAGETFENIDRDIFRSVSGALNKNRQLLWQSRTAFEQLMSDMGLGVSVFYPTRCLCAYHQEPFKKKVAGILQAKGSRNLKKELWEAKDRLEILWNRRIAVMDFLPFGTDKGAGIGWFTEITRMSATDTLQTTYYIDLDSVEVLHREER